ncbi:MAG: maleylpyruvate isomerase N-terminal domain-containing protein [Chloroflexi bacterium]|nr:maleylpyruvate isomerase N-terminal domain-containing protein [Chloroflexota bacterium]
MRMKETPKNNEAGLEELRAELAAEREALLAVVPEVDEPALSLPTRNAGWTVRDVLAHVLASDADLIALLEEAARSGTRDLRIPGLEKHQREMARWAEAAPRSFARKLRNRGGRWLELLTAPSSSTLTIPVSGNWWPQNALSGSTSSTPEESGAVRPLADVVADWRGHDAQHAEDVRLALGANAASHC